MRRDDLARYLERGNVLGFTKQTDGPDYLGWILLQKMKPQDRYLQLLKPGEEPEFVAEQELYRSRPYQVRVIELDRNVHESDRYETEDDYRLHKQYYFSSLDEVEEFVASFGHTLENIKWRIEIDAP